MLPTLIDRSNLAASLWGVLYCVSLVVSASLLQEIGVSVLMIGFLAVFVLPFVVALPIQMWERHAQRVATEDEARHG